MSLDQLAIALIALAIFDWLASVVMVYFARRLGEPALVERAIACVVLSAGATAVSVVAVAYLANYKITSLPFFILAFFCMSIPQLIWVTSFLVGRFR